MKQINLKLSLTIGFGLMLALLLALTLLGLAQMRSINAKLETIVTVNNYKTELITIMRDALRDRTLTLHSLVLNTSPFDQNDELYEFHENSVRFGQALQALNLSPLGPKEQRRRRANQRICEDCAAAGRTARQIWRWISAIPKPCSFFSTAPSPPRKKFWWRWTTCWHCSVAPMPMPQFRHSTPTTRPVISSS
jgi:hypothetical protein